MPDLTPEERQRIYEEEKIRESARSLFTPLWRLSDRRRKMNYVLLAIFALMALFAIVLELTGS